MQFNYFFIISLCLPILISSTIQCYKCSLTRPSQYSNETTRLCSEFDYSNKFIVDCPYSTFCMKRVYSAKIPDTINATERDCASQKYVTQNFKNGKWQQETYVKEPYTEDCITIDDKGLKTSITEFCYCKGNLCNSSERLNNSMDFLMIAVIINLFNQLRDVIITF